MLRLVRIALILLIAGWAGVWFGHLEEAHKPHGAYSVLLGPSHLLQDVQSMRVYGRINRIVTLASWRTEYSGIAQW